ncbi:MAG: hypothetical protein ACREOF_14415 [Gemmatimonadales bacterium]
MARLALLFYVAAGSSGVGMLWHVAASDAPGDSPAAVSMFPPDTSVVWGPLQFNGSSGQGQTYVEAFTVNGAPVQGRQYLLQYLLRLANGTPSGTQRASKVTIRLNGFEIVSQKEVTQQVAELSRPVAITATDTLRITVAGEAQSCPRARRSRCTRRIRSAGTALPATV